MPASKTSIRLPLKRHRYLVVYHHQNKIAEDQKVCSIDHLGHRISKLKFSANPMWLDPQALRALPKEIFPALQVERPLRRADVLAVVDGR